MTTHKKVGIILAGGESRRYGTPKALERIDGLYFYEKAIQVLQPVVDEMVLVAHPTIKGRIKTPITVVTDLQKYQGQGPLAGIYTGMMTIPGHDYFVLACDMPVMETEIFQQLYAVKTMLPPDCSVIPTVDEKLQPLAAIYSYATKEEIPTLLDAGERRLTDLLQNTNCAYIQYSSIEPFKNINKPEDYTKLRN
ncbi:molybdenum cofactor guanylyltransferase [Pseudalkalibacillus sp. Hm43]|uniref:molybdenum cofactor guanylyltransferase n=1 Tax=Pseudalkalibacillus sp. Hm43 TaxID=3450742 RepID=UPI003F434E0F